MTRRSAFAVLLLAVLLALSLAPATSGITSAQTMPSVPPTGPLVRHVLFAYYRSGLFSSSGFMGSAGPGAFYFFERAVGEATLSNRSSIDVNTTITLYQIVKSSLVNFTGNVTVELFKNGTVLVESQLPYLARVVVYGLGHYQLAWAGLTEGAAAVYGLAYSNCSATVELEFLNGTGFYSVNLTVPKYGVAVSERVSALLYNVSVVSEMNISHSETIVINAPRRYSPFFAQGFFGGMWFNASAGFNVTKACFNGTLMPALIWRARGLHGAVSFLDINFYGVNGTLAAFVREFSVNVSARGQVMPFASGPVNFMGSQVVIGIVNGSAIAPIEHGGWAYVAGQPVVVAEAPNGLAMSTAYVNLSHEVVFHGHTSLLVEVSLNGSAKVVVVTPSNETVNVSVVRPLKVNLTSVVVGRAAYRAQIVVVNLSNLSVPIVFNVTEELPGPVTVYKVVNGTLVQLNSTNYFVYDGKIVIFDDPSTTYYVVYNSTATPITTTSTTSTASPVATSSTTPVTVTTTVTTPVTTTSTTVVTSTVTSTSVSVSTSVVTSSSTVVAHAPPSPAVLAAVAAVVVIAVIAIVIIATRR